MLGAGIMMGMVKSGLRSKKRILITSGSVINRSVSSGFCLRCVVIILSRKHISACPSCLIGVFPRRDLAFSSLKAYTSSSASAINVLPMNSNSIVSPSS